MAEGLKRSVLQKLAKSRIGDAELLLANQRFSGAFYLAGYAVEIGLKACIARRMVAETIPDIDLIRATYVHSFKSLVGVAGLLKSLQDEQASNATFAEYWAIGGQWGPEARYTFVDELLAQMFVQAVNDPNAGILRWIKQHW